MMETKVVKLKSILLTLFMLLGIASSSIIMLFWFSRDFRRVTRGHVANVFGLKLESHHEGLSPIKMGSADQATAVFYEQLGVLLEECNRHGLSSERKGRLCLAINQLKEWLHEYELGGSSRDSRARATRQQIDVLETFVKKSRQV